MLDARGCAKPIRLSGKAALVDGQGAELDYTDGPIFTPCKNRRATVCESCSAHYAHDTFDLVFAGLIGGKGVPETVTDHVQVLATLTAPSFGAVHSRPERHGTVHRCRCGTHHGEHDPALGTPLDPETCDYVGEVLWQAHAGELWRRFTIATARALARHLGVAASRLRDHQRLSYAKVAEYQRRGVVHFHAVVRIDGPEGPDGRGPPPTVTLDVLAGAIRHAATTVAKAVDSPDTGPPDLGSMQLAAVRPSHLRGWVNDRSMHLAPSTLATVYFGLFVSMFRAAVADKLIGSSPCLGVRLPEIPDARYTLATPAQVHALADAMPEMYRAIVYLAAGCGWRAGECSGLERDELDLDAREVHVRRQLSVTSGRTPFLALPETKTSNRTNEVPTVVADVLTRHLATYPVAGVELDDETDPRKSARRRATLVVTREDGRPNHRVDLIVPLGPVLQ